MLQVHVLVYSFVIGYAAAGVLDLQPAPCSCTSSADCGRNQCCYFPPDIAVASKKRQEASILPFPIFPAITGTCQDYEQEGEFCGGKGCGCAPGLICDFLAVASRAADNDTSSAISNFLPAPAHGFCRSPPNNPPCGRGKCTQDSDCANGCCYYGYPVLSKRLLLAPISGECRPYQRYREPCNGDCGCEPGLICNYGGVSPTTPLLDGRCDYAALS